MERYIVYLSFVLVGIIGVNGIAGFGMAITHTPSSNADVFNAIVILQRENIEKIINARKIIIYKSKQKCRTYIINVSIFLLYQSISGISFSQSGNGAVSHCFVSFYLKIYFFISVVIITVDLAGPVNTDKAMFVFVTRRVTVGSLSALPIRWPSSVLVRRKRRRMFVALVNSLSTGE